MSTIQYRPNGQPYVTYDDPRIHEQVWEPFRGSMGWDVGANQGQSVQEMLNHFQTVVAYEPAWESYNVLAEDWSDNDRVYVRHEALSDHIGDLYLSERVRAMPEGQLIASDMPIVPGTWWEGEVRTREVPCTTLDFEASVYGTPDFIKIDVEGGELSVLAGASNLLSRNDVSWLVEWHSLDLRQGIMDIFGDRITKEIVNPRTLEDNGWFQVVSDAVS
jgi:FkbM family methyltransferase